MKRVNRSVPSPRAIGRIGRGVLLALAVISVLGGKCSPKEEDYFKRIIVLDAIAPLITFGIVTGTVLNDDKVCINVTDDGGSGLDEVTAFSGTTMLPVTAGTGANAFNINIGTAPEGAHAIQVRATDNAGNEGTASTNVIKDVTDPTIDNFDVPDDQSTSAASLNLNWSWRISDLNLVNLSHFELRLAGTDGIIGSADDQAVPQGTSGGQANNPIQDVTCTGGNCSADVTIFNGAPQGMTVIRTFYARVNASDNAKNCTNQNNPNTTTSNSPPSNISWIGPAPTDFNLTFDTPTNFYFHRMTDSDACARGGTSPAQPGASYTINWTGAGLVGQTTRSGALGTGGDFFDRQLINQFGPKTANVSVTSGGVTRSGSVTVNVEAAQGTCPASSSSRFKRGIVGLLPDGVTLLGLRPVAFRYRAPYGDPAVPQIGLLAEEVVRVYPEAVALDASGRPEGIYYGMLTGRVIETLETRAAQSIQARIARLSKALE